MKVLEEPTSDDLLFYINGERFYLPRGTFNPSQPLASFIRNHTRFTGTKISCGEGGCGACAVFAQWYPTSKHAKEDQLESVSINACLRPLALCDGMAFTTTEGLGTKKNRNGFHIIQSKLAKNNGSQCGFCTPGMVMSLYSYLVNDNTKSLTEEERKAKVETAIDGNICRCTGYRPIVSTAHELLQENSAIQLPPFPAEMKDRTSYLLHYDFDNLSEGKFVNSNEWVRPTTIQQLKTILSSLKSKCKIVCGHTSYGVAKSQTKLGNDVYSDLLLESIQAPESHCASSTIVVDISHVSQLWDANHFNNGDSVSFGAAVSISNIMQYLEHLVDTLSVDKTRTFKPIVAHLQRIAGNLVRNVGSWAGNIAMAKTKGFPSDLATLLIAANATVFTWDATNFEQELTLEHYLEKSNQHTLLTQLVIPYSTASTFYRSYKSALRHFNAHALLNAAFECKINATTLKIDAARLVFGGANSNPGSKAIRAVQTEAILANQPLTGATLSKALNSLEAEIVSHIVPEDVYHTVEQPEGKIKFRKELVYVFFYKYFVALMLEYCPSKVDSKIAAAGKDIERASMTASDSYAPKQDPADPVGKAIPKLSALLQASGEAKYIDDLPPTASEQHTGVLHGAMVCNPSIPIGILREINFKHILEMEGVIRVLTAVDIPGQNDHGKVANMCGESEPVFVPIGSNVSYVGQPVALVVATSQYFAEAAANKVQVIVEGHGEKPIFTIPDAIHSNSYYKFDFPSDIATGNTTEALKRAPNVSKTVFKSGSMVHFYMEKQVTLAFPDEDRMIIHSATQNPNGARNVVSTVLGIHPKNVTVKVRRTGGAFGGKITRCLIVASAASVAAYQLGMPVKVYLDIYADQSMTGGRCSNEAHVHVGYQDDGKIVALEINSYIGGGAYSDCAPDTASEYATSLDGSYRIEHYTSKTKICRMNYAPRTALRAPGHVQSGYVIESVLDYVAQLTNIDPVLVRERNFYNDRNAITPLLQPIVGLGFSLSRVWSRVKALGYEEALQSVKLFNQGNRWKKRGIAVIPVKYGVARIRAGSLVSINNDGSITVHHSGIEVGQGIHTRVAQVAAHTLGAPLDCIHVADTNTEVVSQINATGGSVTTGSCCEAVRKACLKLVKNMAIARETLEKTNSNVTWFDIVNKSVDLSIELSVEAHFSDPGKSGDATTGIDGAWNSSQMFSYFNFGAAYSVVELDALSGESKILKTNIVFDMGDSINPGLDIGQIEGAFVMGLGFHLHEDMLYHKNGAVISNGTWEYKPPCVADIPISFNIELLKDNPFPKGVLRSKAVGEPPKILSFAAFSALRWAIAEARRERKLQPFSFKLDAPATIDRVEQALEIQRADFIV